MLTYLGGVLPPHLGLSPRRHTLTHDWLWSTGTHPHSFTSTGLRFGQLSRDALSRAYVLDALDASIEAVNEVVHALERSRPNAAVVKSLMVRVALGSVCTRMSHDLNTGYHPGVQDGHNRGLVEVNMAGVSVQSYKGYQSYKGHQSYAICLQGT